jgi:hypothetical protein
MEVIRIIDGDERSLGSRLARVLAVLGPECTVLRFTYWYTGPPAGLRGGRQALTRAKKS